MTENILYTPFDLTTPVKAGRKGFWKQVLPFTTIKYKGQKVKFDKSYVTDLTKAFRSGAYDQVPIVFADAQNRHTADPRSYGGEVLDMAVREDGLYALVKPDRAARKAINKNPRLGVSARIRQGVEKSDGRTFDKAIEHLCLTLNPRVTGMGPWQAVDLSDEDADTEVVDLTAEHYKEEDMPKGATKTRRSAKKSSSSREDLPGSIDLSQIDLSALDDDQFGLLVDLAATATADPEDEVDEVDDDEDLEEEIPRRVKRKKSKTKITIDKDDETDDPDDGVEDEIEDEDVDDTDLSEPDDSGRRALAILGQQRWSHQREGYLRDGVPAFILDLAEPVMERSEPLVIDLSDEEDYDVNEAFVQILDGLKGIVDLTGEIGSSVDLTADETVKTEADGLLNDWTTNYG